MEPVAIVPYDRQFLKESTRSKNIAVLGENLTSLVALQGSLPTTGERLSVDVIYIDPPYNIGGNQGYKNTWRGKSEKTHAWAGGHGAFLDFMEPRIKIAHSLLSDEGIMFISICDAEYSYLKILLNQIFGEANELTTFVWDKGQGALGSHVTVTHEYILCYAKNKKKAPALCQKKPAAGMMINKANELLEHNPSSVAQEKFKKWISDQKRLGSLKAGEAQYCIIHPKNKRIFQIDNSCAHDDPRGSRCRKALLHPVTKKPCPVPKNGWKWKEETLDNMVKNGLIWFGKDHATVPRVIKYLDEQIMEQPHTVIHMASTGKNDLPDGVKFTTPKPVQLIRYLLSLYPKNDFTVLDFFAGSGTTAHAVWKLNKEDGGQRVWVLIEEMASTFHNVLLPRINHFDNAQDYSMYQLKTIAS